MDVVNSVTPTKTGPIVLQTDHASGATVSPLENMTPSGPSDHVESCLLLFRFQITEKWLLPNIPPILSTLF